MKRHYDYDGAIGTELPDALGSLWCYMVQPIISYLKVGRFNLYLCFCKLLIVLIVAA
jgi:hypothetical protein